MSKRSPQVSVLTANRLADGSVVFLAADGNWVESIGRAAIAQTAEEAGALQARGAQDAAANLVVEPYLAAIAETGVRLSPARMRERVRVEGPSVLADVPGYVAPGRRASPRATPTSRGTPTAQGEDRSDGQAQAPAASIAALPTGFAGASALPARAGRGDPRAAPVEAA
jgi:hypothetical protein